MNSSTNENDFIVLLAIVQLRPWSGSPFSTHDLVESREHGL